MSGSGVWSNGETLAHTFDPRPVEGELVVVDVVETNTQAENHTNVAGESAELNKDGDGGHNGTGQKYGKEGPVRSKGLTPYNSTTPHQTRLVPHANYTNGWQFVRLSNSAKVCNRLTSLC